MLIGYARISTDDKQSLDLQIDALLKAGVDRRHIFEDKASGVKQERKGLKAALEYLQEGDTLVVWKLDRLGRSLSHLISIINELKAKKVAFKSLTEQMDTTTASGELFFHLVASLTQYERSLIQERINAGLQAARERGRVGGRPRVITEEKLGLIKEAVDNGMSIAKACRVFGVKRTTLVDNLKR